MKIKKFIVIFFTIPLTCILTALLENVIALILSLTLEIDHGKAKEIVSNLFLLIELCKLIKRNLPYIKAYIRILIDSIKKGES